MSRRLLFALTILAAAALAGTAAADRPEAVPVTWANDAADAAPQAADDAKDESPAHRRPDYTVELRIARDGQTLFAPKVILPEGEQATVNEATQRPFVVGIDLDGKPIVRVLEEGTRVDLVVTEGRDGVVALDATVAISQIEEVGRKGAVQTVRVATQQTRIVEPILLGDSIVIEIADGTEITAVVNKLD